MATTTQLFSGIPDGRASSKVLAPPGGKSSFSFGFGDSSAADVPKARTESAAKRNATNFSLAGSNSPVKPVTQNKYHNQSSIAFGSTDAAPVRPSTARDHNASSFTLAATEPAPAPKVSECQSARGKSSVFSRSPLKPVVTKTSAAFVQSKSPIAAAKPSTRVINPPGGRSSNIFG